MTATVESWTEETGQGWAVTTWPMKGHRVLLLRRHFRSPQIRAGRVKANLKPGDGISFTGIGQPGGRALRIVRSSFDAGLPFATVAAAPTPQRRLSAPAPTEDEIAERRFVFGEDAEDCR